jgi:hypothetical protein
VVVVPIDFDRYDDYLTYLYGGKFFSSSIATDPGPMSTYDLERGIRLNSLGYRSEEFSAGTELLIAGCSYTSATGVPDDGRWGNLLAKKLGTTSVSTLASPGIAIDRLVDELFTYFSRYGNPKYLAAVLPDPYRVTIPIDGDVLTWQVGSGKGIISTRSSQSGKHFDTVYTNHNYDFVKSTKVVKKPIPAGEAVSTDAAMYSSIRAIRHLEQYCKSANIQFVWGTWSRGMVDLIDNLNAYEFLKFDSYSKKISDSLASSVSTKLSRYICYPDWETKKSCLASHGDLDCTECTLTTCHQSLLDIYPDHFYIGDDVSPHGVEHSHPGVHVHAHCADAFYQILKDVYVK